MEKKTPQAKKSSCHLAAGEDKEQNQHKTSRKHYF